MNIKDICKKSYEQFHFEGTTLLIADNKANFQEMDGVAYFDSNLEPFAMRKATRLGQRFILGLPDPESADAELTLERILELAVKHDLQSLAISFPGLFGENNTDNVLAKDVLKKVLKLFLNSSTTIKSIVFCTDEMKEVQFLRQGFRSLIAVEKSCAPDTYCLAHAEGEEPLEKDLGGKVTSDLPETIEAGSLINFKMTYHVGRGLLEGAEIAFAVTHPSNWMIPQFAAPKELGYTTVSTNSNASLMLFRRPACGNKGFVVNVKVLQGQLRAGESFILNFGDPSEGCSGIRVQTSQTTKQVFKILGDMEDVQALPWQHNDFYLGLPESPACAVKVGSADMIDLICPSKAIVGEDFQAIIRCCDRIGNLCDAATLKGKISINDEILQNFELTESDESHITIKGLTLKEPGVHKLELLDNSGRVVAVGNPMVCQQDKPDVNLFWGDLHMHSELSDGTGEPDSVYDWARNVAGMEIAALADHDFILSRNQGAWQKTIELAGEKYEPGSFVTLLGYEFTERKYGGDRNVYYLNDEGPLINSDCNKMHPDELYKQLSKLDYPVMVIPHGVITEEVWTHSDPRFCRLAEVYSTHGSSESNPCEHVYAPSHANYNVAPPKSSYSKSFAHGLRMGVVGGTDDHGGQPGWGYNWHNYRGGIMGVYAKELTRESVWEALWNRRTIATTGERIALNLTVNGLPIGSEGKASGVPEIEIEALGTDKIDLIEILRNETILHCFHGNSWQEQYLYFDHDWDGKPACYRCRLTQRNGERAWTSPIWIQH